jgi:hypothetical protein
MLRGFFDGSIEPGRPRPLVFVAKMTPAPFLSERQFWTFGRDPIIFKSVILTKVFLLKLLLGFGFGLIILALL